MKLGVLAVVLLLFAASAKAEPFKTPAILQTENLVILLTDKLCFDKTVLGFLEERVHSKYRAGIANHKTLGYRSLCYLEMEEYDQLFIIDDQYGQVDIPKSMFSPATGDVKLNDFKKPGTGV